MPAVGINISDFSVKYMELVHAHGSIAVKQCGKVELPIGTIEGGEVKDMVALTKVLATIQKEKGLTYVHLALPEEHAYLFQTEVPKGSRAEVEQMLEFHLKENVPIAAEEAVFDYSVVKATQANYILNVSVYPAPLVAQYADALAEAGLTVLSAEIEGQATARALLRQDDRTTAIIIDVGRSSASLSISTGGVVGFTAGLEIGGDQLTRSVSRHLNISFHEAENLKRRGGFCDTAENKSVYEALAPTVTELKNAISKHYRYWQMHADATLGSTDVSRVILVGGNANLRGMPEYLEVGLDVPIETGNVWENILSFEDELPPLSANESLEYATAVGLALRSIARGA